ncbi:hypothetical protein [Motiliproteus sp. SC1-56]|uniref:hypothetical protein n=1 Tax=Motiliproteus sp. SC1-56 TaxID=2799565 RepID=UPI001A8F7418|nr:hypothetical protein [Motiliproteus sp. SC1-56]
MGEHRDASDRLTFDFQKVEASAYSKITEAVANNFNLTPANLIARGLDEMFQDYRQGDMRIGLEWDNWSGYIVCAKDKAAEPLAKEIASYINAKFNS